MNDRKRHFFVKRKGCGLNQSWIGLKSAFVVGVHPEPDKRQLRQPGQFVDFYIRAKLWFYRSDSHAVTPSFLEWI